MRLSAEAMNAALADFQGLNYQTKVASAYDVFLTMKWLTANRPDQDPWQAVAEAVDDLFGVFPEHELGRLRPCRYDWLVLKDSGRKTVWNNNTRGIKLSSSLLVNNHIRNGLLPDASSILGAALPPYRPSWQSLAVLVLRNNDFSPEADWPTAKAELLQRLGLTTDELEDITSPTSLGAPLLSETEWDETTIPEALRPPESMVVQAPAAEIPLSGEQPATQAARVSISVDRRVERMLRLALRTTPSILLVGPPGTGKGTLLKWVLREIAVNPERYGFEAGFDPHPLWRTPDESWTAYDLIGGLSPDSDGALTWSAGALLNAIEDGRWLILDETNRGDMDKIMGPLLTWLSDQEVEVGRSAAHEGKPQHVGWGNERQSKVSDNGHVRRYLAGTDFRLLGTYNPQDAQRVFRFGQALSRRFVVIPVPAIQPGQFTQLLENSFPDLGDDAAGAITGLYRAHLSDDSTALGPAVFLRMAKYLLTGLPTATEGAAAPTAQAKLGEEGPNADETPLLAELLAEAYVTGIGRYLAGFDDRVFDALGQRIVNEETALPQGQWTWVSSQRHVLS
ncbi:AAA family ATPase [Micromonospora sp. NPDC049799]|uniref:AAA family ATPase n=1 Tax=Micromonospora sp. NPDC049799 TaxID=3154741 RepID=UPI0033CAC74F